MACSEAAWWRGRYPKGSGNRKGLGPGERIRVAPGVEVGGAGLRMTHPLQLPSPAWVSEVGVATNADTLHQVLVWGPAAVSMCPMQDASEYFELFVTL